MLWAFGARDPSPLTCLLAASTIHHQGLVLSKNRRKKKSTKIMMAGLIPSKSQALRVSQMPHSGPLPFQSQQVERGTQGRINMTKGSGPGSPCIFDYHPGTELGESESGSQKTGGKKKKRNGFKNKTPSLPRSKYYTEKTTWSLRFVSLDAGFLSCLPPLDWALNTHTSQFSESPRNLFTAFSKPRRKTRAAFVRRGVVDSFLYTEGLHSPHCTWVGRWMLQSSTPVTSLKRTKSHSLTSEYFSDVSLLKNLDQWTTLSSHVSPEIRLRLSSFSSICSAYFVLRWPCWKR